MAEREYEAILIGSGNGKRHHLRLVPSYTGKTLCGLGTWSLLVPAGGLPADPLCQSCAAQRDRLNANAARLASVSSEGDGE